MIINNPFVIQTQQFIDQLFEQEIDKGFVYHDKAHTLSVVDFCLQFGQNLELSEEDLEILYIAALLHDTGLYPNLLWS